MAINRCMIKALVLTRTWLVELNYIWQNLYHSIEWRQAIWMIQRIKLASSLRIAKKLEKWEQNFFIFYRMANTNLRASSSRMDWAGRKNNAHTLHCWGKFNESPSAGCGCRLRCGSKASNWRCARWLSRRPPPACGHIPPQFPARAWDSPKWRTPNANTMIRPRRLDHIV